MNTTKFKFAGLTFAASFGLTAATIFAMSAPAYAGANVVQKTRVVATYDLDLKTPKGQGVLHHRVRRAAKHLCIYDHERMLTSMKHGRRCVDRAVANAVPQIDQAIRSDFATVRLANLPLPAQP